MHNDDDDLPNAPADARTEHNSAREKARKERLTKNLKANLHRRKQQNRHRKNAKLLNTSQGGDDTVSDG